MGNTIAQYTDLSNMTEPIQIQEIGKYGNFYIKNNTFINPQRAAVSVVLTTRDNFQINKMVIEDNVMRGSHMTSANALLLAQLESGNPIADLQIKNNSIYGTQSAIWAPSVHYAENLTLTGNNFYKVNGAQALWLDGTTPPLTATISNNFFDGAVTGFSTSTTVTVWENNNCGSPAQCASVE
jgi:hypothetical protein